MIILGGRNESLADAVTCEEQTLLARARRGVEREAWLGLRFAPTHFVQALTGCNPTKTVRQGLWWDGVIY